jgi:hypothetical protein
MQTKWSEISSCKSSIQNKAGLEQVGLLALSMTSPMYTRAQPRGALWMSSTDGHHIGTETTNLDSCTIDDFIDGREGALSMTSLMDATEGEEQNNLKQNNNMICCMNHQLRLKLTLAISKQEKH